MNADTKRNGCLKEILLIPAARPNARIGAAKVILRIPYDAEKPVVIKSKSNTIKNKIKVGFNSADMGLRNKTPKNPANHKGIEVTKGQGPMKKNSQNF